MALGIAASVHANGFSAIMTTAALNAGTANCYIVVNVISNSDNGPASGVVTVKSGGGVDIPVHSSYVPAAGNATDMFMLFSTGVFNDTVVVTQHSGAFCTVDAFAVSGSGQTALVVDSGGPVQAAFDPVTITTNGADRMVLAFFRESSASDPTAGAGFTKISGADYALSEYQIVPSATTVNCTQTTGAGSASGCIATAIPQVGGAPPPAAKVGTLGMMGV
jgi:hypothetical protein